MLDCSIDVGGRYDHVCYCNQRRLYRQLGEDDLVLLLYQAVSPLENARLGLEVSIRHACQTSLMTSLAECAVCGLN